MPNTSMTPRAGRLLLALVLSVTALCSSPASLFAQGGNSLFEGPSELRAEDPSGLDANAVVPPEAMQSFTLRLSGTPGSYVAIVPRIYVASPAGRAAILSEYDGSAPVPIGAPPKPDLTWLLPPEVADTASSLVGHGAFLGQVQDGDQELLVPRDELLARYGEWTAGGGHGAEVNAFLRWVGPSGEVQWNARPGQWVNHAPTTSAIAPRHFWTSAVFRQDDSIPESTAWFSPTGLAIASLVQQAYRTGHMNELQVLIEHPSLLCQLRDWGLELRLQAVSLASVATRALFLPGGSAPSVPPVTGAGTDLLGYELQASEVLRLAITPIIPTEWTCGTSPAVGWIGAQSINPPGIQGGAGITWLGAPFGPQLTVSQGLVVPMTRPLPPLQAMVLVNGQRRLLVGRMLRPGAAFFPAPQLTAQDSIFLYAVSDRYGMQVATPSSSWTQLLPPIESVGVPQ